MQAGGHLVQVAQGAIEQRVVNGFSQAFEPVSHQHQFADLIDHSVQPVRIDADGRLHPRLLRRLISRLGRGGCGRSRRGGRRSCNRGRRGRRRLSGRCGRRCCGLVAVEGIKQGLKVIIADRLAGLFTENGIDIHFMVGATGRSRLRAVKGVSQGLEIIIANGFAGFLTENGIHVHRSLGSGLGLRLGRCRRLPAAGSFQRCNQCRIGGRDRLTIG